MTKQERLIQKLDRHPGGPIELTQDECVTMANVIEGLLNRIELQGMALKAVETGIWHDKATNTCGVRGLPAGVAHLVEAAIGKRELKK